MSTQKRSRTGWGNIRQLPSGRWQARYTGPDGLPHKAHTTFDTKDDADEWLATVRTDIVREKWLPPSAQTGPKALQFAGYTDAWLAGRRVKGKPLAARTRSHYRSLLDTHILPTFGPMPMRYITPEMVDEWHAITAVGQPTLQAHAYSLLRTILGTAAERNLIPFNPAKIRGAGSTSRVRKVRPLELDELETLVKNLPERYRLAALLSSWCALRFGELAELRRNDIDTKRGVIHVRRGVVRADGETIVKTPKSDAGIRDVAIPPHLMPLVREHQLQHTQPGKDGLLFPAASGGHLAPSTLYRAFYPAREAAGRPDLRWHDLRHTGAVMAAQTGATLAELMGRLGHSTPGAAMRYQHAADERDAAIARKLSEMATRRP
ncbi:tyrosine-type recombinase/integrase [Nocardioides marmoraquaticus]